MRCSRCRVADQAKSPKHQGLPHLADYRFNQKYKARSPRRQHRNSPSARTHCYISTNSDYGVFTRRLQFTTTIVLHEPMCEAFPSMSALEPIPKDPIYEAKSTSYRCSRRTFSGSETHNIESGGYGFSDSRTLPNGNRTFLHPEQSNAACGRRHLSERWRGHLYHPHPAMISTPVLLLF